MMLALLNQDDWDELERKYPEALAWLRGRSLLREWLHLKRLMMAGGANDWQRARFQELDALYRGE